MKNAYQRKSYKEKKEVQNQFKNTDNGKILLNRLKRIFIVGVVLFFYSGYLIYEYFINKEFVYSFVGILSLISSLVFIIGANKLKIKQLNNYLIKTIK